MNVTPRVGQLRVWKPGSFSSGKVFIILDIDWKIHGSLHFDPDGYFILQEGEFMFLRGVVRDNSVLLENCADCDVEFAHGEEKA